MLVILDETATEADLENVKNYLFEKNFDIHQSTGLKHVIIGVIGEVRGFDATELEAMHGVQQVVRITEYEKTTRG